METTKWYFRELDQWEPERDPREAEFFHITNLSEAIVREFIQNSLDAKSNNTPVEIRFALGECEKSQMQNYLQDLDKHLKACGLQLTERPQNDKNEKIPFITIEDFNTTGLNGEIGEKGQRPSGRSNFYNFWLCEGKSLKSGKDGGRWGLGKTTFHIASKIRAFWGLTVRIDDKRELLMGKALLKTHKILETPYKYYSYYGYFVSVTTDDIKPIQDANTIARFKDTFLVKRNKEPGFSLVIPIPNDEINFKTIVSSIIIHYSFAIMKGMLHVVIEDNKSGHAPISLNINNTTELSEIAAQQDWRDTSWENRNVKEVLEFMNSAVHSPQEIIDLPDTDYEDITESKLKDNHINIEELRNSYAHGNLLGFKIPIKIFSKVGKVEPPSNSYFNVFVKKYPNLDYAEEFYFRSGIMIPEIKSTLKNRPVRAMLVAEKSPIATFLGDSETPAHTDWNERTEGFKEKYENASKALRFIKKSISNIVALLDFPTGYRQRDFLQEIFYIEETVSENGRQWTRRPEINIEKTKPNLFAISQIDGGFKVSLKENDVQLPIQAIIKVAYDTRRGNPFQKYDINDFDLASNSITIRCPGCTNLKAERNIIQTTIEQHNFELEVFGFDTNRDLKVDIKEKQNETNI